MKEVELSLISSHQAANSGRPVILQLHGSYEAFGVVFDYLSRTDPFTRFEVGHFSSIIRQQLQKGHHLVAMEGQTLIGYIGWLITTKEIGDLWQNNLGKLTPVAEGNSDAAALTVVASRDRSILSRLIRGARTLNPGKKVYFKREYEREGKSTRKSSVANIALKSTVLEST
jgi:hypothetical protein